ncbi:MAG TPA: ABC transporter ATP-binding protein [Thermoprotei archaeon]|nr:ABC transporter ATP-binding protein [Thermoprotei archaeon]
MLQILLENVSFYYEDSKKPALKNINLKISRGEFILITGPSGCGKTTLCRILNGLIPHFYNGRLEGKINILGKDVRETPTYILAKDVGMVFQNPENQLFLSSVERELAFGLENLGIPPDKIREKIYTISKMLDIEDILEKAPYELSGGQQQKVAIASILIMEPKILILDEPTSNLDPISTLNLVKLISNLNKMLSITIIVVEHRLELISPLVSRIILMKNGRIVLDGDPREVFIKRESDYLGIGIPKVVEVYKELAKENIRLRKVPLSPEELVDEIRRIIYERKDNRGKKFIL